jgi:hypothetical protein
MYCPTGCKADLSDMPFLADERDSAKLKGKIAIGMMAVGGAVAVTGIVLTIINSKAKRILPNVEVSPTQGGATAATWFSF